ncbi:hypothetical protein GLAREA_09398 [Glarea lozoyensis ATCC 20868]|uniref:Sexual differentiation process protein isp4 n=1 Tax=Glarea lozoyensis (strain ATCC 20868 / MF5171) TaxID=1116229 RepID=S3DPC1_GLAL2|nr:uncharacterized protein GLAREA_09398 [Glarea lozoyensis ATCC 20868]EPE28278.1 hypothetical protein GLAREA_09398 [Glarea lozoyensis ATCC 20868]
MYINDLTMFILWMVDAPLLLQKPGGLSCDGSWQYNYWGYYWGTFWRDQPANFDAATDVGSSGCQQWNLVVIFAFVIAFSYLINFVIVGSIGQAPSSFTIRPEHKHSSKTKSAARLVSDGSCGSTSLWFTASYVGFRILGIAAATVVAGLVGTSIASTSKAHDYVDSRIIYTIVIAGLNLWDGLTFIIPFNVFPNVFTFFILWIVDATLLLHIDGSLTCNGSWQYTYWGYYWGQFWNNKPADFDTIATVGSTGCHQWQLVIAFAFLAAFSHFFHGLIVRSAGFNGPMLRHSL